MTEGDRHYLCCTMSRCGFDDPSSWILSRAAPLRSGIVAVDLALDKVGMRRVEEFSWIGTRCDADANATADAVSPDTIYPGSRR
jgi:hypothetical protein